MKSGAPVSAQQVRLGVGQVLEYRHLLQDGEHRVTPVLVIEGRPPHPWDELLDGDLGIGVIRADAIAVSLDRLF